MVTYTPTWLCRLERNTMVVSIAIVWHKGEKHWLQGNNHECSFMHSPVLLQFLLGWMNGRLFTSSIRRHGSFLDTPRKSTQHGCSCQQRTGSHHSCSKINTQRIKMLKGRLATLNSKGAVVLKLLVLGGVCMDLARWAASRSKRPHRHSPSVVLGYRSTFQSFRHKRNYGVWTNSSAPAAYNNRLNMYWGKAPLGPLCIHVAPPVRYGKNSTQHFGPRQRHFRPIRNVRGRVFALSLSYWEYEDKWNRKKDFENKLT
jgi:hypothetical protein